MKKFGSHICSSYGGEGTQSPWQNGGGRNLNAAEHCNTTQRQPESGFSALKEGLEG